MLKLAMTPTLAHLSPATGFENQDRLANSLRHIP